METVLAITATIARICAAIGLSSGRSDFEEQLETFLPNIVDGNERGATLLKQLRECIQELDELETDLRDSIDSELDESMIEKFKDAGRRVGRLTLRKHLSEIAEAASQMNKLIQSRRESRKILGPAARKMMNQLSEARALNSEIEDRIKDVCDLCYAAARILEIQEDPNLVVTGDALAEQLKALGIS